MLAGLPLPLLLLFGTVIAVAFLLVLMKLLPRRPVLRACFVLGVVSVAASLWLLSAKMDRAMVLRPSWAGPRMPRVTLRPPAPPEVPESQSTLESTEARRDQVIVESIRRAKQARREGRAVASARSHDRVAIGVEEPGIDAPGESLQLWLDPVAGTVALRNDARTLNGEAARWTTGRWSGLSGLRRLETPGNLFLGLVIAAFLYVGYLFLDTSTRGHFTWSLRLLSVVAFAALCVLMAALRQGF